MSNKWLTVIEEYEFLELIAVFDGLVKVKCTHDNSGKPYEIAVFVQPGIDPYAMGYPYIPHGLLPYHRSPEKLVYVVCKFLNQTEDVKLNGEDKGLEYKELLVELEICLIKFFREKENSDCQRALFVKLGQSIAWLNVNRDNPRESS